MKRNILLTLIALMCAVYAQAVFYDVKIGDLYYNLYPSSTGNTATVTSPSSSSEKYSGDIVIPSSVTYDGTTYSVTEMENRIFVDCTGLTTVQIPGSIEIIAESAFKNCTNLISVTIGDGVKTIAGGWESKYNQIYYYGAFMGCTKLQSLNIPNSVTEIGAYAFEDCIGLTSVTIPNSVTTLGICAFRRCSGITALHIGNGITTIESGTFCGCTGLTSLNIPNCVMEIKGTFLYDGAFEKCTGLTSVTIPNSITNIGYHAFRFCSRLTSVTIPNSVTNIGCEAFCSCRGLTSVTIPNSVKTIGSGVFAYCTNLTSVTIGNGVTLFGEDGGCSGVGTFEGCTSLTSITIPNNVKEINNAAFADCTNLKFVTLPMNLQSIDGLFKGCTNLLSVSIPNSVKKIGDSSFEGCTSLTSIVLPEGITSIGARAFKGCTGLTSVIIPNSVTEIGGSNYSSDYAGAFYGCSKLSSITIGGGITKIGNYAFGGCTNLIKVDYTGDIKSWLDIDFGDSYSRGATNPISLSHNLYINGKLLTNLDIPQGVTTISDAFKGDTCITTITMPNSVTTIEASAFAGCKGITSVSIGSNVTSIGSSAFDDCDKLAMITIPNKVTQIGGGALRKCQNVVMLGTIPPSVSNSTFSSNAMIRVPCGAVDSYLSASSWSSYSDQINGLSYNVTLSATEGGSAKITSSDCSSNMMTIEATPASAYKFVRWNDGNTENPRTMTVTSDINLTAEFIAQTYTIAVTCDPQQGTVTGGGEYIYNTNVTIEAIPNAGYEFIYWDDYISSNPRSIRVYEDHTYRAIFKEIDHTITVTCDQQQGSVFGGGTYTHGATVTLAAVANKGYKFVHWSDGATDNPYSFTATEDATYTATFEENKHTIAVTCDPQQGSVLGSGTYADGAQVTLVAIANKGYEFSQWSNGVTDNPYLLTATEDLTIEAQFVPATAVENISADGDTAVRKVFRDGQVLILRDGKTYTTTGVEVK